MTTPYSETVWLEEDPMVLKKAFGQGRHQMDRNRSDQASNVASLSLTALLLQMLNNFMQQPTQFASQSFAMDQLRRDLPKFQNAPQRAGSPGWASEFGPGEQARMEAAFQSNKLGAMRSGGMSPADFARFQQRNPSPAQRNATPLSQTQPSMNGYQRPMGYGSSGMAPSMMMHPYGSDIGFQQPQEAISDKGKGRMVELDDTNWEVQFAEMESAGQTSLDDEANAAIEAELNSIDRSVNPDATTDTNNGGDFQSLYRGIQAEMSNRQMADSKDFADFDVDADANWDQFDSSFGLNTHNPFDNMSSDPELGTYIFEEDNAFLSVPDPFQEGVQILESNGNLTLAALAFEAAVQQHPEHIEAWVLLGSSQAQNEKESPAIRALEQALRLDPNHLTALMSLAVSYTNEGYESSAYRTLERWLSVKYPSIISPDNLSEPAELGFTDRHILHNRVTDLFIEAAQLSPTGAAMDPDVQVGLGVLFYGDEEFEKAVDCFSAALASTEEGTVNSKTQIHLLWNRLGATLANSGRSEDAIAAYEKALTLNPNFVRARYNLGVSCINIGCYPEAAQHLLGALSMHRVVEEQGKDRAKNIVTDGNNGELPGGLDDATLERMVRQNESSNLYETLRRAFASMGRRDLSEKVGVGMNLDGFRREFDF